MRYESVWWSVDLPAGWDAYADAGCSTFKANPEIGVLQISAARKSGHLITEDELREYASERIGALVPLRSVAFGDFSGFIATYQKETWRWQELWLRSGHLMVYATYVVDVNFKTAEDEVLRCILASLQARPVNV